MTGGRLKRVKEHIGNETFCFTYGDGVSNVNKAINFNTTPSTPGRFGAICLGEEQTTSFREKPEGDGAWVNSGFFVLEPK